MARSESILNDALQLSEEDRAELALRSPHSVEAPDPLATLDDDAWRAESARRAEAAVAGEATGSPWSAVRARLEARLPR